MIGVGGRDRGGSCGVGVGSCGLGGFITTEPGAFCGGACSAGGGCGGGCGAGALFT
jgi:hypothetical protein